MCWQCLMKHLDFSLSSFHASHISHIFFAFICLFSISSRLWAWLSSVLIKFSSPNDTEQDSIYITTLRMRNLSVELTPVKFNTGNISANWVWSEIGGETRRERMNTSSQKVKASRETMSNVRISLLTHKVGLGRLQQQQLYTWGCHMCADETYQTLCN